MHMHSEINKMKHAETPKNDGVSLRRAPDLVMVLNTPKGSDGSDIYFGFIRLMQDLGRGIIAARSIHARTIIEVSPVLVMPSKDLDAVKSTTLYHYT